jgi:hypothetical protein
MTTRMIAVAATVLAGMVVPACSSTSTTTSSGAATSTSAGSDPLASAAPTDYTTVLIQGSDITTTPPNVFTPVEPPVQNPDGMPGAAVVFKNQDDSNRIGDTVLILTDAGAAANAMNGSVASLGNTVTGGTRSRFRWATGARWLRARRPISPKW